MNPQPVIEEPPLDVVGVLESAGTIYEDLVRPCEAVMSIAAKIRITGSVQGRRVNAQVWLGSFPTYALRLEPVAGAGDPSFRLSAKDEDGTLLFRSGNRVVHERVAVLMNAAIGVPLNAREFHQILTCPGPGDSMAWRVGERWLRFPGAAPGGVFDLFVQQDLAVRTLDGSVGWKYSSLFYRHGVPPYWRWRVDFLQWRAGTSRLLRIRSLDWTGEAGLDYDLTFSMSDIQLNAAANPSMLDIPVPESAQPATLGDLGSSLPLIGQGRAQR